LTYIEIFVLPIPNEVLNLGILQNIIFNSYLIKKIIIIITNSTYTIFVNIVINYNPFFSEECNN